MAKRGLPRSVWEAVFEKLEILTAQDHSVEALSAYQYRIDRRIDLDPDPLDSDVVIRVFGT